MPICPNCGSLIPEESKFCPNCGKPIILEVVSQPPIFTQLPEKPKPKSYTKIMFAVIVALAVSNILIYASLQRQINSLNTTYVNYKTTHTYDDSTFNTLKNERDSLTRALVGLNEALNLTVTQHYEWTYGTSLSSELYQWNLPIPLSLYYEYYKRPRPTSLSDYVSMAKDSKDDYYIDQMIQRINSVAIKEGYSELEKVNFVIAFVQSLPYTADNVTTRWNEYPRYPIETLFDQGGDCEDTSILTAALLSRLGYDVALLLLPYEKHAAVGISIAKASGSYYEHGGKKYYYLETTGEGWKIGQMPSFKDTRANIYPLNL